MNHRTLHVIASLAPSGLTSQLATLAAGLTDRGHTVRVAALRDGAARGLIEAAGAVVDVFPRRHRVDPLVASRLRRVARDWRPSVVHAWDSAAAAFAHAAGAGPLVARVADTETTWHAGRVDRSVRRYLAASQPVATAMTAAGCAEERVVLAPRGVAPLPAEQAITRDEAFAELRLPASARVFAIVSRLAPEKSIRELIWAADLMRVLDDNARLVLFGDGPARGGLERFTRMASDLEHMRFAGFRDDVRSLLPHFELLWHAGQEAAPPVAVLEAMAAGLPVVADRAPGVCEAVVHGVTGFVTPVGGRAERARVTQQLFDDRDLRTTLGAAARQRVTDNYSVNQLIDRVVDAYESVQPEAVAGQYSPLLGKG